MSDEKKEPEIYDGYSMFESIKIGLASPEKIRSWSHGEVTLAETINYRTLKPELGGLFCEKIFGPAKDGECHCGKYKKNKYKGVICDKCGVEVTSSKVRRIRMGHIELAAPVAHIWFFKGVPCKMALLLGMSPKLLEKVLYFQAYIVVENKFDIDVEKTLAKKKAVDYDGNDIDFSAKAIAARDESKYSKDDLDKNSKIRDSILRAPSVLSEEKYEELVKCCGDAFKGKDPAIRVGMGATAVKELLQKINIPVVAAALRIEIEETNEKGTQTATTKKAQLVKRLEVVESFNSSKENKPEWMVLDVLPVIPPDLRPMVQLDGGRFATSDLNDLYRRVINRNLRLKKLQAGRAPAIVIRNEMRMLQEAVDALFDNTRRTHPVVGPNQRNLRSLSDMLKGKQGRFRQTLLGKRVDYSGRSVIVVGPELRIYQCGLPKEMALELFKPFIARKLMEDGKTSLKVARKAIERGDDEVWMILEEIIKDHPVLLNRAPTLHRLGIQAFEPVLVEGRAIKLHPLVCTAYNADFDGDQMAVHVPLSSEAQAEARFLMLSANNLLAPKDGKPITVPTQDMVLGSYYLTLVKDKEYKNPKIFASEDEAKAAFDLGIITLHTPLVVGREVEIDGKKVCGNIKTTMGKLLFNQSIPQDLGFVDRTKPENYVKLEVDKLVKKDDLKDIIEKCIKKHGLTETAVVLDNIKSQGYKYSTRGAITVGVADINVPDVKKELIAEADKQVDEFKRQYRKGLCTDDERYRNTIEVWKNTIDDLTTILKKNMGEFNNIFMMSDSGARGNINQIKQLAGMRGLMSDTSGKTIEIPIKANFREGLDVLEFFISSHGTRKTLSDTALRTADSGYLTRRLVDVSHEVIIREEDCGTDDGITIATIFNEELSDRPVIVPLRDRISGRYMAEDVYDPSDSKKLIIAKNELVTDAIAKQIEQAGIKQVRIRSVLTCESRKGVCAKCYGTNLATNAPCNIGEVVGIIAAQSIGEPGTQLTMRTFHTGGVATADDITQGLPRVEELFEARKPKGVAVLAETSGTVRIVENSGKNTITIIPDGIEEEIANTASEEKTAKGKKTKSKEKAGSNSQKDELKSISVSTATELKVSNGDHINIADPLYGSAINPNDLLKLKGVDGVQKYIIEEVQKVYNSQGVKINDRHLEVITRQMLRKYRVIDPGDTNLLPGGVVDIFTFRDAAKEVIEKNRELQEKSSGNEAEVKLLKEPVGERILLGITKAALATESFLSAASFQETTKVLSDAAIKGKIDTLLGLKENVIIGKLIPAGTGLSDYNEIDLELSKIKGSGQESEAIVSDIAEAPDTADEVESPVPESADAE